MRMQNVCVIGTGYVGLVTAACLADVGHKVIAVDKDAEKIEGLKNGIMPIYEDGLKEIVDYNYVANYLSFTTDLTEAVRKSDIIFICVGTPSDDQGNADLVNLFEVAVEIGYAIDTDDKFVVVKSTVPVGTNDRVEEVIKLYCKHNLFVVSNPEFLREGVAVKDFMKPDRIVIGAECNYAYSRMNELYEPFDALMVCCTRRSAELGKYGANAFLSAKIAFVNEMADLCEVTGADIGDVAEILGTDNRIGSQFLKAGPGFGGSCFPKDIKALINTGRKYHKPIKLIETVVSVNEQRMIRMAWKIEDSIAGPVEGKTIAFLGLTFKAGTDDMRSSPALTIIPYLVKSGYTIKAYDPAGMENAKKLLKEVEFCPDIDSCVEDADAIVILTEWPEFHHSTLDYPSLTHLMNGLTVIDLRNMLNPAVMEYLGFNYVSIGR